MTISAVQIRQARELLNWSRAELARRAFLPIALIDVVEDNGSTFMLTGQQWNALRRAFERGGVEFIPENGGAGGVRLRKAEQNGRTAP